MYSYGPPHMAEQKQDDQLEHTYSSYVGIQDVALKTCQRRWTIGGSIERGSGISVLAARHDDDDVFTCTCIGFHPGRFEPASSRVSTAYHCLWLLIKEDILGFDWGKCPKSYSEKPVCRRFSTDALTDALTRGRWLPEQTPPGFSPLLIDGRIVAFVPLRRVISAIYNASTYNILNVYICKRHNTNTQVRLYCSGTNGLLTSILRHKEKDTILTMLTQSTFGTSRNIQDLCRSRPEKSNHIFTGQNPTLNSMAGT